LSGRRQIPWAEEAVSRLSQLLCKRPVVAAPPSGAYLSAMIPTNKHLKLTAQTSHEDRCLQGMAKHLSRGRPDGPTIGWVGRGRRWAVLTVEMMRVSSSIAFKRKLRSSTVPASLAGLQITPPPSIRRSPLPHQRLQNNPLGGTTSKPTA